MKCLQYTNIKFVVMKRILLSFIFIFVLIVQSVAQVVLPAKCEVFKPLILQEKILKETDAEKFLKSQDYGQNDAVKEKKHWYVYSDRSGNKLYSAPGGSHIGSLEFNERVIIAKISKDWALIYDDPVSGTWPLISNKAKAKGWIKMDNLLLWDKAISDNAKIMKKALLVHNLDANKSFDQNYYSNPETNASLGKYHPGMDYYFIFKEDRLNNKVLLAKQSNVDGSVAKLYGWFSIQSLTRWNQRSCIEPNWDVNFVDNVLGENERLHIYKDPVMNISLVEYKYGVLNDSISFLEKKRPDLYSRLEEMKYRMPRYALRYPVLSADADKYECTAFASINGSMEAAMRMDAWKREMEDKMIKNLTTVNLIFIIDGTSSMKDYFHYVKQAISECKYFTQDYTFKVGLVIYRDYPDGEDGLCEYIPMSEKDDHLLNQYLDSVGRYGAKSSPSDHTHTEALYKGLELALDKEKMGYKDKENVVFVVIGDCGNAVDDKRALSQNEIITRMVESNINLLTFQVRRPNDEAFNLFNTQMSTILSNNIRKQYKELGLSKASDVPIVKVKNGYDLKLTKELEGRQYKIASMRYAQTNGVMTPKELAELLDEQFGEYVKILNRQIDIADLDKYKKYDSLNINTKTDYEKLALGMDTMNLIKALPGGVEDYQKLKTANQLLAYTGYALKTSKRGGDYWKPIAFLSQNEFDELMKSFGELYEVAKNPMRNPGVTRERYANAMKGLAASLLPELDPKQIESQQVEYIMALINGLNERSDALKTYTIKDILMPEKVSDDELRQMINSFRKKYENLREIRENYLFTFEVKNIKYYWIPIKDLP